MLRPIEQRWASWADAYVVHMLEIKRRKQYGVHSTTPMTAGDTTYYTKVYYDRATIFIERGLERAKFRCENPNCDPPNPPKIIVPSKRHLMEWAHDISHQRKDRENTKNELTIGVIMFAVSTQTSAILEKEIEYVHAACSRDCHRGIDQAMKNKQLKCHCNQSDCNNK